MTISKSSQSRSLCSIQLHPLLTTGFSACQLELTIAVTGVCLKEYLQYKNTEAWKKTPTLKQVLGRGQVIEWSIIDDIKASQILSGAKEDRDTPTAEKPRGDDERGWVLT